MASLQKDSRGRSPYWYACFRGADGRRLRKSTKTADGKKAMRLAIEWEKLAETGRRGHLIVTQARRVVDQLVEEATGEGLTFHTAAGWLRDWVASKAGTVSPATAQQYRRGVEDFLEHLGRRAEMPLASVSPRDISSLRDALRRAGLSVRACNALKQVLNIPFSAAARLGIIPFNPVAAVGSLKEANAEAHREPFSAEEVSRLLAKADGDWYGAILTGRSTGLRLSDIVGLTWGNVDLDGRDPLTGESMPVIRVMTGKTRTRLVLPIHADLASWLASQPRGIARAPVFPSLYGRATGGKYGLSRQFAAIVATAEISHKITERTGAGRTTVSKTFHSLRHGIVTEMANLGIPPDVRQRLVGHASAAIHAEYTHHGVALLRAAVNALPSVVSRNEKVQ
jgi:integrase